MGSGGFGTNASVHWRISHSDGRGSVPVSGRDPIPYELIGEGVDANGRSARKGHQGFFRVELRFKGSRARGQIAALIKYLSTHPVPSGPRAKVDYRLVIDVPIIRRTLQEVDKKVNEPFEVTVDW